MMYRLGDWKTALKLYAEVKEIFEKERDKKNVAVTLHQLGMIHHDQGNYEEAVKLYQQSLDIEQELGNKGGIAGTLHQLGNIHYQQGNCEEAVKLYQQSLKIKQELGDKGGIARTLHMLGVIYDEKDEDFTSVLEKYLTALSIYKQLRDPYSKRVESLIASLKERMGEKAFNKAFEEIRRHHGA